MRTSYNTCLRLCGFLAVFASLSMVPSVLRADIIEIDVSGVPLFIEEFKVAEAFWESRIQNYSSELPPAVLTRLSKLRIVCRINGDDMGRFGVTDDRGSIDGPGMILAQAGPTRIVTFQSRNIFTARRVTIATQSLIELDFDDMDFMIATGLLQSVVTHEMGHALGFGSIWDLNNLTSPLGGIGLTQYTGGTYAIREYRKEIQNPVVNFVPLEQAGGEGTVGGHWSSISDFFVQPGTTELMTGFASFGPIFVSETTWGSLADLGYEVAGINVNAVNTVNPTETLGSWPKTTGNGIPNNPTNPTNVIAGGGTEDVEFHTVNIRAVIRLADDGKGKKTDSVLSTDATDPYRLRHQRWVK